MGRRFRLLSIDGGGIRGLLPALVLAHLEKRTGRPVHQLFDAVAATSTGAVIALGLLQPDSKVGEAQHLAELYLKEGPKIFAEDVRDRMGLLPRLFANWLGTPLGFDVNDLWRPRYKSDARRKIFRGFFEDTQMTDALLPVVVPTYCTRARIPVLFVSRPEHDSTEHAYYEATSTASMLEAAMCATAAPTYFPPELHPRMPAGAYSLIDGSVFAANPTAIGRAFLRDQTRPLEGDIVLSLGTGAMQRPYEHADVKGWGLASWAGPLFKMLIDGQCETTGVQVQLDHAGAYLRVQGLLGEVGASDELDDCRVTNLTAISHLATALCDRYEDELDAMAKVLQDEDFAA